MGNLLSNLGLLVLFISRHRFTVGPVWLLEGVPQCPGVINIIVNGAQLWHCYE